MTVLKKNSDLDPLTTPADGDYLTTRDVSDTTNKATGETKRITAKNLNFTTAETFSCSSGYNINSVFNTDVKTGSIIVFSPTNSAAALIVKCGQNLNL